MILGPNEFEAFVLPYGISSDDDELYLPGSLAICEGREVVLLADHVVPIGTATLHASDRGIWAHGRICSFLCVGARILEQMREHPEYFELCLSTVYLGGDTSRETFDGREFSLIHKASPTELSLVRLGALPETKITAVGTLSHDYTEWDRQFADTKNLFPLLAKFGKYWADSTEFRLQQSGPKIAMNGATYRSTSTANRGLKIDSSNMRVYDNAGNEKLSANLSTGAITVTGAITADIGSSIATGYLNGTIGLANLDVANRGWVQTCAFSVTDADTVAWGAGVFTAADGTAYNINAGNTGNMAAKTYIYLNTSVSTVAYQTTTTAATAVGAGKVLVAIAQNGTGEATFMVMNGQGAKNIDASEIVAGSITANEIAASTITGGKIAGTTITGANIAGTTITADKLSVSSLSAIAADLGTITAGTVTGATIRTAASGQGIYLDSSNGLQAKDSSGNVLTQISLGGLLSLKTAASPAARIEIDASYGLRAYDSSNVLRVQIPVSGSRISADKVHNCSGGNLHMDLNESGTPGESNIEFWIGSGSNPLTLTEEDGIVIDGGITVATGDVEFASGGKAMKDDATNSVGSSFVLDCLTNDGVLKPRTLINGGGETPSGAVGELFLYANTGSGKRWLVWRDGGGSYYGVQMTTQATW